MNERNQKTVDAMKENGDILSYGNILELPDGNLAATMNLAFTVAIVSGIHELGYEDRWCYHNYYDAQDALEEWAEHPEMKEPTGWHRHPSTGRRKREDGTEYINF